MQIRKPFSGGVTQDSASALNPFTLNSARGQQKCLASGRNIDAFVEDLHCQESLVFTRGETLEKHSAFSARRLNRRIHVRRDPETIEHITS